MQQILMYFGKPITYLIKTTLLSILFVLKLTTRLSKIHFPNYNFPKLHITRQISSSFISWLAIILVTLISMGNLSLILLKWYQSLPSLSTLENPPSLTTKILDRNGALLYQIYRDENRSLIKLTELPNYFIQATIAIEDKNFFTHHGLDFIGIIRAFSKNIVNCRLYTRSCTPEGGSTITQQLIKNTLLTSQKNISRKLKEAVLAIMVEREYSKEKILELYLNEVNYGGTAYGIQAASEFYFNKSANQLTLSESALLAGLTTSPTTLSPLGSHPYLAKERQLLVLSKMVENGFISQDEKLKASLEPLILRPKNISISAPHFVMWLKEQLVTDYGEDLISQGGLTITTTLDLNKQQILESEINQELLRLQNLKVTNAAGLITNPQNGEVLAMVGSHDYYDYEHDGQVNITTSKRQPGSSIKPITYLLALMNGLGPNSTIEDAPACFASQGQPPYCPQNYDGRFHGSVTLRTALASSYNIPAVKLLNSLGITNMINLAKQMGITTWDNPSRFGLSLTLGGGEVKMVDMAEVYGTIANNGTHVPLKDILSITDSNGRMLKPITNEFSSEEVIPPSIAFQISNILSDNLARSPAFGYNSVLNIPNNQVAVKTGTTNNLRDNWTFGYTQNVLVATWVGNNDNSPMSSVVSGITGASPIWRHTIDKLLDPKNPNVFTPPPGTRKIALCKETKGIYCKGLCPSAPIYEYFTAGSEPKDTCQQQQSGTIQ
ncbi:MAG: transglycosylase domain-containing protein [bacterium]